MVGDGGRLLADPPSGSRGVGCGCLAGRWRWERTEGGGDVGRLVTVGWLFSGLLAAVRRIMDRRRA